MKVIGQVPHSLYVCESTQNVVHIYVSRRNTFCVQQKRFSHNTISSTENVSFDFKLDLQVGLWGYWNELKLVLSLTSFD